MKGKRMFVLQCRSCCSENPAGAGYCRDCGTNLCSSSVAQIVRATLAGNQDAHRRLLMLQRSCLCCGAETPADGEYCTQCGRAFSEQSDGMLRLCAYCGGRTPANGVYCIECGRSIEDRSNGSSSPSITDQTVRLEPTTLPSSSGRPTLPLNRGMAS
jgi:ribosomal protein L40E